MWRAGRPQAFNRFWEGRSAGELSPDPAVFKRSSEMSLQVPPE
jgi:hypothetical protein